jgi:TRAP-type mannitol/chloroaromatic compound transport system permease large subunit
MLIRRVIIPAILALGFAGSILAGSAAPTVAAQAPAAHALAMNSHMAPRMHYYE